MERQNKELEILNFISKPENEELKNFLLAVHRYLTQNELDELFPIQPFMVQLIDWLDYLHKPPVGLDLHSFIINEPLYSSNFSDFERYIILDILSTFLDLINYKTLNFIRKYKAIEQFADKRNEISQRIKGYSLTEIKAVIDSLAGLTKAKQIEILTIYKRLYFRIAKIDQGSKINFITLVDLQVTLLRQNTSDNPNIILSEAIDKLSQEQQIKKFDDTEKLYIPDVAEILKCHESQVRRLISRKSNPLPTYRDTPRGKMYFFYPEIMDWQKSHKLMSPLEEAGEVFRRKAKGSVKKHRPRLG